MPLVVGLKAKRRLHKGQLALSILIILVLIVSALMLCGLAVDTSHLFIVRKELQAAVDAGALAGGLHLSNFEPMESEQRAIAVTALNTADGLPVNDADPSNSVSVEVFPASLTNPVDGQITVSAQHLVKHFLAPLFGHPSDTVTATATAASGAMVTTLARGQMFPAVVSIDAIPDTSRPGHQNAKPLIDLHIGDTVFLDMGTQTVKNIGFTSLSQTSASASYIKSLINAALGVSGDNGQVIPSIKIGDRIQLNNGQGAQNILAEDPGYSALLNKEFIVLPVVQGDPTLNQSQAIIAFVGVKVTSIERKNSAHVESIIGQLVKPIVNGSSNMNSPDIPQQYKLVIKQLAPVTVHIAR